MNSTKYFIFISAILIIVAGCNHNRRKNTIEYPYIIPEKKLEGNKKGTEKLIRKMMKHKTDFWGVIEVPQQNVHAVSFAYNGTVKRIMVQLGDTVFHGQPIASIESAELTRLQQEYLEKKYELDYYKQDFERQGELTLENATSIKKLEKAQADYLVLNAKVKGLEARLRIAGINPQRSSPDNIILQVAVYAPVTGIITDLPIYTGKFIKPENNLAIIQEMDQLNVVLNLTKEDFYTLYNTDTIKFVSEANSSQVCKAKIFTKRMLNNNQEYQILARICETDNFLQPGYRVKVTIPAQNDSVWAVPVSSVIWGNDKTYMYVLVEENFIKKEVVTGSIDKDYIEIRNVFDLPDNPIILKNVENLYNF
ncbi:MAG: efflux RND transporter periplasmic adaptor subunit [Bacteroidales bacterium]|nr:efflux RND transporter periplasmic adaptor subunit [Bacteroidales bacterium]